MNSKCSAEQNIECEAESRLDVIKDITLRLPSLNIMPEMIKTTDGKEASILRILSTTTGSRATLIHPRTNQEIMISMYSSPIIKEPGFWIKDNKCFGRIDAMVSPSGTENVRFSLIVHA